MVGWNSLVAGQRPVDPTLYSGYSVILLNCASLELYQLPILTSDFGAVAGQNVD